MLRFITTIFVIYISQALAAQTIYTGSSISIDGELKKWHKVTLTFDGPMTSEADRFNPYLHYRLDVTFRHTTGKVYTVPGYYAADGDAGESSSVTGNKWRVHFAPDEMGDWTYEVSFRKGNNVILGTNIKVGHSGGYMDGMNGVISIAATDKSFPDLRARGRLKYTGQHYLQFAERGDVFLKFGADAPENLLSYADFDGDFHNDGHKDDLVKTWSSHLNDWREGDPTWQDGKGKAIIGAINYLEEQGMNAFSFLTLNIAGDDQNVYPYLNYDAYDRIDVSKMDQWEVLFEHADHLGMFLHFKTSEVENQGLLDGGNVGLTRTLYYRELIARFGHHLALNWNIGEENGKWDQYHPTPYQTTTQRLACAQYFYDTDPYHHHLVIHNGQQFYDLLGPESKYSGISLQTSREDFSQVHDHIIKWRKLSSQEGKKWACAIDEPGDHRLSLVPDAIDPDHDLARQNALWGALLGGAWGIEWYFGYVHEHSDLSCEDWRSREAMWIQNKYASQFFMDNSIPVYRMEPMDQITENIDDYVLASENDEYIVYMHLGSKRPSTIPQITGTYDIAWYNPKTGTYFDKKESVYIENGITLRKPVGTEAQDWVVHLRRHFDLLTNGRNLDGWYTHFREDCQSTDPGGIFHINEEGDLEATGECHGYIATNETFGDFYLSLEYRWGAKRYEYARSEPANAGVLYRMSGPDKIWPRALECQLQNTNVGDFWLIDSTSVKIDGIRTTPKNFQNVTKRLDNEHPVGEWNKIEVIARGGYLLHIVNGAIVNEATEASEQVGKIILQSEGTEIHYRDVKIKNL